eukprot:CAMPEP_0177583500 /NCGR_PEP_ID=MMETSP0419_2-20121207/3357_1 /TAXON_ID=582737 /ORGANISM="Tetraselmis sp., Strain GSL018" /LENGTH=168 /DNA_ID=CAMNT_0019072899 /DNA_START=158 /DNA_END=664 /DNA_ORIENTATION=+
MKMWTVASILLLSLGVNVSLGQEIPQTGCNSMLEIVESLDFLSTFLKAIRETGVESAFERDNIRVTLLAPTNGAFQLTAAENDITVDDFFNNTYALRRIVQNHVVPGRVEIGDVELEPALYGTMDFGNFLELSVKEGDIRVETEDGSVSARATELLYDTCNNVSSSAA